MRDWWLKAMLTGMLERIERYRMVWSDASLTTMGGYGVVLNDWEPQADLGPRPPGPRRGSAARHNRRPDRTARLAASLAAAP